MHYSRVYTPPSRAYSAASAVLATELLEVLLEESAHGDDAVGHALDLTEPLLVEGRIVEDLRSDAGTVNGRVGVQWADQDLDLGVDALLLLGRLADDGEGTNTLAVETHVLGERLGNGDLVTLSNKVTKSKSIPGNATRSEALVSHIKEGEELLLLDDIRNDSPLFGSGVDTSRVVRTSVKEHDGVLWSALI